MSANSEKGPVRKASESESYDINISNENHVVHTHNENNVQENNQSDSAIVKIDYTLQDEKSNEIISSLHAVAPSYGKQIKIGRDFMVYGYPGQNQALPTTLVYFQPGGREIPSDGGAALDYTPDRNAFVRLVFIIVFIMIACTAALNTMVYISDSFTAIFKTHGLFLAIGAMILMVALNYAMACSACARIFPCNIICLVLAVIGMSILCCYITVRYDTRIILLAVMATAGVVFVCILLACTSFDFTKWALYILLIAAAFGVIAMTVSLYMLISGNYIKILHLVILVVGTVIQVVVLTMELQMILGGKAIELSEDDYALGAFLLYTSIIDIFLKLVQILGIVDDW